jgi:hypothetical protein
LVSIVCGGSLSPAVHEGQIEPVHVPVGVSIELPEPAAEGSFVESEGCRFLAQFLARAAGEIEGRGWRCGGIGCGSSVCRGSRPAR